jgi:hypothetical protein
MENVNVYLALLDTDRGVLIGCLNLAGSIAIGFGLMFFNRRLAWREGVDKTLELFRRKFQALKDRHGLDTTIDDD